MASVSGKCDQQRLKRATAMSMRVDRRLIAGCRRQRCLPDDVIGEFEAVDFDDNEVVVNARAIALATVTNHFEFSKSDRIDRESMPLGMGSIATDVEALRVVVKGKP